MRKNTEEETFEKGYIPPKENRLSEVELQQLDNEMKNYLVTRKIRFPEEREVKYFDEVRWLKDRGAFSKKRAIKITGYKPATYFVNGQLKTPVDCDPILYEQLQADLQQHSYWKGKKEFVEDIKIKGLSEVYDKMDIKAEEIDF